MKLISYKIAQSKDSSELLTKKLGWSEANEAIAKAEAWGGEYTIEDDGEEETSIPTTEERIADLEKVIRRVRSAFEKIGISIE